MDELIERLRAVKWEVIDDDDWDSRCVFVDMRPDEFEALLRETAAALEAAREDARKWQYWANGPQGTFLTDDLELATAILAAYDKDDDWTVTDIVDPTGATIDQALGNGVAGGA